MAPPKKLTDEALKNFVNLGFNQDEIARLSGLTKGAISQRMSKLSRPSVMSSPPVVIAATASLWDVKRAAEENYARALELLKMCDVDGASISDRAKVLAEIRRHFEFSMNVMQTMYSINETQAFQEEVLTILDECEPGTRERILERLRQRRTVRAAFITS